MQGLSVPSPPCRIFRKNVEPDCICNLPVCDQIGLEAYLGANVGMENGGFDEVNYFPGYFAPEALVDVARLELIRANFARLSYRNHILPLLHRPVGRTMHNSVSPRAQSLTESSFIAPLVYIIQPVFDEPLDQATPLFSSPIPRCVVFEVRGPIPIQGFSFQLL